MLRVDQICYVISLYNCNQHIISLIVWLWAGSDFGANMFKHYFHARTQPLLCIDLALTVPHLNWSSMQPQHKNKVYKPSPSFSFDTIDLYNFDITSRVKAPNYTHSSCFQPSWVLLFLVWKPLICHDCWIYIHWWHSLGQG